MVSRPRSWLVGMFFAGSLLLLTLLAQPQTVSYAQTTTPTPTLAPTVPAGEQRLFSISETPAECAEDSGIDYPLVSISDNGRIAAFTLAQHMLVEGCFENAASSNVVVRDRQTGEMIQISVDADGNPTGGFAPALSADGRFVAYTSPSDDLLPEDTNGFGDVLVYDRQTGETELVSVASDGTQGNNSSGALIDWPDITMSADGRFVAFTSRASNLVPDDTNEARDVFVHDRQTDETTRVSIASDGSQFRPGRSGTGPSSYQARISADGFVVAFVSYAAGLVRGDDDSGPNVFVHDRRTGETNMVSLRLDPPENFTFGWDEEAMEFSLSADGRFVTFGAEDSNLVPGDTNGVADVFVYDRMSGATTRVSVASDGTQGNDGSNTPWISGDGRFVTFFSQAKNFVDEPSGSIYVHDRLTGETTLGVPPAEGESFGLLSFISADGRFLTFSDNDNAYVYERTVSPVPEPTATPLPTATPAPTPPPSDQRLIQLSRKPDGSPTDADTYGPAPISADGRIVAFQSEDSDLGNCPGVLFNWDVFVYDQRTGETTCVSVDADGNAAGGFNAALSADGRFVAFETLSDDVAANDTNGYGDIVVHDRETGETTLVSVASDGTQGNGCSGYCYREDFEDPPALSADGRFVAFSSEASNLVPDDTNNQPDIFVHDRETGETTRVSVASDGSQLDTNPDMSLQGAYQPVISADGNIVGFSSFAQGFLPGDEDDDSDIFLHDRRTGETTRVLGEGFSAIRFSLSADGRFVGFSSNETDLVPNDTNDLFDSFVYDRETGETTRVSVASDGTQGNGRSWVPYIAADNRTVLVPSQATNLAPEAGATTIYLHDLQTGTTSRVMPSPSSEQEFSFLGLSSNGRFLSLAASIGSQIEASAEGAAFDNVFVYDVQGAASRVYLPVMRR